MNEDEQPPKSRITGTDVRKGIPPMKSKKDKPSKERKSTKLRSRKTPQNSQQLKIQNLEIALKTADNKRKQYFEDATLLKGRNIQLLEQREKLLAQIKINENKAFFYERMIDSGLDMNEFFTSEKAILAKHTDLVAIKEKIVD